MALVMVATMLGAHSSLRILAGTAALLALAIGVAPLARRSPVVRGHVLDCFAMALALLTMLATSPVDDAGHGHASAVGIPIQTLPTLALVAAGWAAARLALLLAARTGRRMSLVGATLTAAGLALMAAM